MKIERIDHVAIAVKDLEQAVHAFVTAFGLEEEARERLDDRQLVTSFLRVGDAHLELIESLSDQTPIAKHILKRGAGVHHICFEVDDLDAVLARCRDAGLWIVGGGPEAGARGKRVAFIHPRSTGGVLVELSENVAG